MAFSLALIAAFLFVYIMIVGKHILVPLVVAIFFWYLINALAEGYKRVIPARFGKIRLLLAITTFIVAIGFIVQLVSYNIPKVVEAAPQYQINLMALIDRGVAHFEVDKGPIMEQVSQTLNLRRLASSFASGVADVAGNTIIIIVYLIFLLLDQGKFGRKVSRMFPEPEKEKKLRDMIGRVYLRIETYLFIKTITSTLTAVLSYFIMAAFGLDFAAFWAVLIFILNYIPNIGSIIATVFPSVLAVVQFDTLYPFFFIAGGITALQFLIGSVIEPRFLGNTLNLSPIVILLSLVLWGTIWGVAGMFLCIPLTVILVIAFSEFPKTRPIAVLLSSDGKIRE